MSTDKNFQIFKKFPKSNTLDVYANKIGKIWRDDSMIADRFFVLQIVDQQTK